MMWTIPILAYLPNLPDDTKPNNRRPIKRKSKENLGKEIIRFYIEKQRIENRENITLEELYIEWLLYKRDYTSVKAKTIQEYVSEWNHRALFHCDTIILLSVYPYRGDKGNPLGRY